MKGDWGVPESNALSLSSGDLMSISQSRVAAKRTAKIAAALLAGRDLSPHHSIVPTLEASGPPGRRSFDPQDNSFTTIQEAMDALTVEMAVIDETGKIILASRSWRLREENTRPSTSRKPGRRPGPLDFLTGSVGDAHSIEQAL